MKSQFIKDLKDNDEVDDLFAIKGIKSPKPYRAKNGLWISLFVSDPTGGMEAKFWGAESSNGNDSNELFALLKRGDVVRIKGKVQFSPDYPPAISINPGNIIKQNEGEYDPSEFVAKTEKDIPTMISELKSIVSTISNPDIRRLVNAFVDDEQFMEKFSFAPAAKKLHHAKIGGLLEHVVSLLAISLKVVEKHLELDKDYLIAACIFHDIGKLVEYKITSIIDITDEGRMLGHISIGEKMINDKIDELENFPEPIRLKIIHMILSHHGKLEYGSPVKPCIPEAIAFAQIDDTDAQIQKVIDIKNDANPDEEWVWIEEFRDSNPLYLK